MFRIGARLPDHSNVIFDTRSYQQPEDAGDHPNKRRKLEHSYPWQAPGASFPYHTTSQHGQSCVRFKHSIPAYTSLTRPSLQAGNPNTSTENALTSHSTFPFGQGIHSHQQASTYAQQDTYVWQAYSETKTTTPFAAVQTSSSFTAACNGLDFQTCQPTEAFLTQPTHADKAADTFKTTVCYGKLCGIPAEIIGSIQSLPERQPFSWDGCSSLQHPIYGYQVAKLSSTVSQILRTLSSEALCEFQFHKVPLEQLDRLHSPVEGVATPRCANEPNPCLSITIYGSRDMATQVGDWLSSIKMYLQIPEACDCDRDVPYMNPHCLDFDKEPILYTSQLRSHLSQSNAESRQVGAGAFCELYTDSILEEAPQPQAIGSPLHPHQKQALTFMIERERGWDFTGDKNDIWKSYQDAFGGTRYKNMISGFTQARPPETFCGGILADDMGLGKTCTMLSMVALDLEANYTARDNASIKRTLIVVPFPLLFVWEKQIREHFRPRSIRYLVFYGSGRQQDVDPTEYQMVLTTYNTVSLEWKTRKSVRSPTGLSLLFDTYWHRIILDEAHVIRTRQTACAKSVCALQAERRWCITGTPIQNRLTDIFSLFRFLRVHPYDDIKIFEEQILRPWRLRMDEDALKRVQSIVKAVTIRRPRSVVALPEREERTEKIVFTAEERAVYEKARTGVIEILNEAMNNEALPTGSVYLNTFQRINDLRYICNHSVSPRDRKTDTQFMSMPGDDPQALINAEFQISDINLDLVCRHCGAEMPEEDPNQRGSLSVGVGPDHLTPRTCEHCAQHGKLPISPPLSDFSSGGSTPLGDKTSVQPSSKIDALVAQVRKLPPHDKCVVFSYWTSTLDAIEQVLNQSGISLSRYDGRLSRIKRSEVLTSFNINPSIRVILVSISCGGQGLDLTAANHAFLVEPQWNPMLEEQAMARVHRLGQKKAVHLVRLVMQDTWEEKIISLQGRKLTLAGLIVDRSPLKKGMDGKKQLHYLRELLA